MKFETPKCPTCGEFACGTVDTIEAVALLSFVDSEYGEAEWAGETKVEWNSQATKKDEQGRALLICENNHTWYSKLEA